MEAVRKYILKHVDGYPVNIKYEPVKTIRSAVRLTEEEFERLMTGYWRPSDPSKYFLQEIEVTYREVSENERENEPLPKD